MHTLSQLINDPETLVSLEPEELAGYILYSLKSCRMFEVVYYNYFLDIEKQYPQPRQAFALKQSICAAWSYLLAEGLIGPSPNAGSTTFIITKKGLELQSPKDIDVLAKRSLLRKALLHNSLRDAVYSQYLSGCYDLAVIQAFKQVEIAVREKSQIRDADGVRLMRAAFKPASKPQEAKKTAPGPLTDTSEDPSEQEGICNLFVGAMGWCRNPVHHRDVQFDTDEAMQLICFASYLLALVDTRKCVPSRLKKSKRP